MTTLSPILFISGIDTDAGKSYATAWLALELQRAGHSVITQKFIQTGNKGTSEDIETHRRLMGIPFQKRDIDGTTAPVILSYPASADLAARIDGVEIDLDKITNATATLASEYQNVLVEGAGGLMVPIKDEYLAIDHVKKMGWPLILVTNSKLGSINHTLLSLEAIKNRGMKLEAVIYNPHFDTDKFISADTREYLKKYVAHHFPDTLFLEMPAHFGAMK